LYYFINDHLGTPQKLTDASGAVVWAADYLPFGKADVTIATVENNLRFAGQYFDSETGLHFNFHRYYDPKLGRYLRSDPSHSFQGKESNVPFLIPYLHTHPEEFNNYSFSLNNPIKNGDPAGLAACGSGLTAYIVPDTPFGYPFTPCCERHDDCYGEQCKKSKSKCDGEFFNCMIMICTKFPSGPFPGPSIACIVLARIYYQSVNDYGEGAFRNARKEPPCCQSF
jgi:RHS repeat-associated protein